MVNIYAITAVWALIENKCRIMIENIHTELIEKHHINISHSNIHGIIHEETSNNRTLEKIKYWVHPKTGHAVMVRQNHKIDNTPHQVPRIIW